MAPSLDDSVGNLYKLYGSVERKQAKDVHCLRLQYAYAQAYG